MPPETAKTTPFDRAQDYLASVNASQLTEPVNTVTVPEPVEPTIPKQASQLVSNITRDTDGFITAQTEEAKQLKELQQTYGALGEQGSLSDLFTSTQEQYGVTPESLRELKDIQLQLTDMDTASEQIKTDIQGAAGQTLGQARREVTQEDREAAVRSAGLAARAEVLQGNIQTANAAAQQAVNIAYQDRQLTNQNLINQIEMVQATVDDQTAQLLEQEKRTYEADLAKVQEVKDAVADAMVSGASQQEIAQLTDPTMDDDAKIALANSITARGATELRNLDIAEKQASISASNALANERYVSTLIDRAEGGDENAIRELGYDPRQTSADVIVPEQYLSTVNQAASLAGAEDQRETTKAIIAKALADENYVQAYSQIANNVEESLTGTVKSRFADARTDIGVMSSMRDAIDDYVAQGGDTGLLKGKAEDIAERFGVLANSKDPEFAALGARLQREFQTYRNIMTGAAFTPEESAEYAAVNPTEDKSLDLNLAIIDGAIDQLEDRVVNTIETRVSGSNDIYERAVSGGADTVDTSWDEVSNMAVGEQFTIGGTLYEKAGEDNYIEVN